MIAVRSLSITEEAVVVEYATEESIRDNGMERLHVLGIPVGVCDEEVDELIASAICLVIAAEREFQAAASALEDPDAPGPYDHPDDRQDEE